MPNDNHVAARANTYVDRLGLDANSPMGRMVWNAYQAGEERGYVWGWEAARLQGRVGEREVDTR